MSVRSTPFLLLLMYCSFLTRPSSQPLSLSLSLSLAMPSRRRYPRSRHMRVFGDWGATILWSSRGMLLPEDLPIDPALRAECDRLATLYTTICELDWSRPRQEQEGPDPACLVQAMAEYDAGMANVVVRLQAALPRWRVTLGTGYG